jgi:hypothetical protein
MFNQILFIIVAFSSAGHAQTAARAAACGLSLATVLTESPIAFDDITELAEHQGQLRGILGGERVFIKSLDRNGVPLRTYLPMLTTVARALEMVGVGPRYFGLTINPHSGRPSQIFGYLEGHVVYAVDERITSEAVITPRTIEDVRLAFDVLSGMNVLAEDAQFMITPRGRAVMIDYDQFESDEFPRDVARANAQKLSWLEALFVRHARLAGAM